MSPKDYLFHLLEGYRVNTAHLEEIWKQRPSHLKEKESIKWLWDMCIAHNYVDSNILEKVAKELPLFDSLHKTLPEKPIVKKELDSQNDKYFSKYRIIKELGSGNMGRVLLVYDPDRNMEVALKIMLAGEFADEQQENRFFSETSAMQRLTHPNIVQIYDVGKHKGIHFFTMEYLEGADLDSFLKSRKVSSRRSVEIFIKVAKAIQHAHEKKILHRDIKPGNVILRDEKDPVITDFGLARSTREASRITQTGALIGTPAYMAPEQARGTVKEIDERTDIYALGITLYKILTRQVPFNAATPLATLNKVVNAQATPVRQINPLIPQDLENICMKAIEKDKEDRYSSVKEMVEDLERFLEGVSVTAQQTPRFKSLLPRIQQYKIYIILLLLLFVSLIGNTLAFFQPSNNSEKQDIKVISPTFLQDKISAFVYEIELEIALPLGIVEIHTADNKMPWNPSSTEFKLKIPMKYGKNNIDIVFFDKDNRYYQLNHQIHREKAQGALFFSDNTARLYEAKTYSITPLKLKWKYTIGDEITFSPLVFNDRIFFGGRDSFFYCLGYQGQELWKTQTSDEIAGFCSIAEGVVYFGNENGDVYGLDVYSGQQQFYFDAKESLRFSPIIDNNTLYMNTEEEDFYAVNIETIEKKWHFQNRSNDELYTSPALYKDTIIIPEYNGRIYALDCKTGKIAWQHQFEKYNYSSPIVMGDVIYVTFGRMFRALDATNGKTLWQIELQGEIVSNGIFYNGMILITNTKATIFAIDLQQRKINWTINAMPQNSDQEIWSSPTIAGDDMFFNSVGSFYSINIKTKKITRYHQVKTVRKHHYTFSSPTISGNCIYVGNTDGDLYAYEKE